jgi:hypothetical protein
MRLSCQHFDRVINFCVGAHPGGKDDGFSDDEYGARVDRGKRSRRDFVDGQTELLRKSADPSSQGDANHQHFHRLAKGIDLFVFFLSIQAMFQVSVSRQKGFSRGLASSSGV